MAETLPRIDHVIIGAKDLTAAKDYFLKEYGLQGYDGGKHQGGWGTENYLIPLGQGYIEIAAVFDPEAAQTCDWGKCVMCAFSSLLPISLKKARWLVKLQSV